MAPPSSASLRFLIPNYQVLTLGDNLCLPPLLADFFNWRHDDNGVWINKLYISLPHFSYGYSNLLPEIITAKKWEVRSLKQISPYFIDNKVLSWLSLEKDETSQYGSFSSTLRRKIQKSQSFNFELVIGGIEYVNDFYSLFQQTMHHFGSPALSIEFYRHLTTNYRDGICKVFLIYLDGRFVGGSILVSFRTFFENCWIATDPKFNKRNVSYSLHWAMISHAIQQKAEIYSFGRSTINSGVHQYKRQWNTTDHILYRNFSHPLTKDIRSYPILSELWRYTPSILTNSIGPKIAKYIY